MQEGGSLLVDMPRVVILCGWVVKIEQFRQQVDPQAGGSTYSPSATRWPKTPAFLSTGQPVGRNLLIGGWVNYKSSPT